MLALATARKLESNIGLLLGESDASSSGVLGRGERAGVRARLAAGCDATQERKHEVSTSFCTEE